VERVAGGPSRNDYVRVGQLFAADYKDGSLVRARYGAPSGEETFEQTAFGTVQHTLRVDGEVVRQSAIRVVQAFHVGHARGESSAKVQITVESDEGTLQSGGFLWVSPERKD
jgi:hypothetical protein